MGGAGGARLGGAGAACVLAPGGCWTAHAVVGHSAAIGQHAPVRTAVTGATRPTDNIYPTASAADASKPTGTDFAAHGAHLRAMLLAAEPASRQRKPLRPKDSWRRPPRHPSGFLHQLGRLDAGVASHCKRDAACWIEEEASNMRYFSARLRVMLQTSAYASQPGVRVGAHASGAGAPWAGVADCQPAGLAAQTCDAHLYGVHCACPVASWVAVVRSLCSLCMLPSYIELGSQ